MDLIGYRLADLNETELTEFLDSLRAGFLGVVNGIVVKVRR